VRNSDYHGVLRPLLVGLELLTERGSVTLDDFPTAQQLLSQRIHVNELDAVARLLREIALIENVENLQRQPRNDRIGRSAIGDFGLGKTHAGRLLSLMPILPEFSGFTTAVLLPCRWPGLSQGVFHLLRELFFAAGVERRRRSG
jgi:hypothetical protein